MLNRLKILLILGALFIGLALTAQRTLAASASEQIESLIKQDQLDEAMSLTSKQLATDPANVTYLFMQGLILTRQNKLDEAKDIFIRLTKDHPELPEPFNNLAVIYAEQGDFNNAREALQMAINTHPSYATAHENLGDIYAKMASRAYNQALELDQDNASAREKLLLVSDLFSTRGNGPASVPAKSADADKIASELKEQEQALRNAESQTQGELGKANQLRQELTSLQAQRSRAEEEARAALAQAQSAKSELAKAQQQVSQAGQQVQQQQQQAEAQANKLKSDIATLTMELQQLTANRDKAIQQTTAEQRQAEDQVRVAQEAGQKARAETAGLEQRTRDLRAAMDRQAAAAEEQLNQSRQQIRQLQAEVNQLQQQRETLTAQTAADRQSAIAAHETQNQAVIAKAPEQVTTVPATKPVSGRPSEQDLVSAVRHWAERWSAQDVQGYLAAYTKDFRPPDGVSHASWEAQRRDRIRKPGSIHVELTDIRVKILNDQHAQVRFMQSYQTEAYKDEVSKTLLLRLQDGHWLISEESTSG